MVEQQLVRRVVSTLGLLLGSGMAISFAGRATAQSAEVSTEPRAAVSVSRSPAGEEIRRAAALIRGTVSSRKFTYDPVGGPRTEYTMIVDSVYEGAVASQPIVLSFLGGYLPDGRLLSVSDIPVLSEGRSYLALLRKDSAFWSPVVPGFLFAIENIDGNEVLIGEDGRALAALTVLGPRFGEHALFDEPRLDGGGFRPAARTQEAARERMVGVDDAVGAIRAIASADQIRFDGSLADPRKGKTKWNEFAAAGAAQ